ncbi:MAG: GGDEF domain-containing protein [Clostridia bacterium]|nr:GGDEF domain-containing protein [Clostridia bacterium]
MDLQSYYITNSISIVILLILYYVSRTRTLRYRTEDKIFSVMVFGVMFGSALEIVSYILDGTVFPGARILSYFVNTLLFTANMLLPFSLIVYVDLYLYGDPRRIWKKYKPQIFTAITMITLNIVNIFVPLSFYINDRNIYERRPLVYLYYAVIVFYCVTIMVMLKRYEKENGAKAFLNFNMFLVPVIVGCGLQFFIYGLSLAWLASAIGIVGLFMMQQNEMAYIDPLVNTYNRQYLDHILSVWISRGRKFAGVMLDMDKFKQINDCFGHSEGDRALQNLTKVLKSCCLGGEFIFRFAGDEFIIIKLTNTPDELQAYMNRVNRKLEEPEEEDKPYRLSVSYGISFFKEGNIDTFMKEMDDRMYEMKEQHHKMNKTVIK